MPSWNENVLKAMEAFAKDFGALYSKRERELAAYFEIGCFLSLVEFYERSGFSGRLQNLARDGSYRYLTTPNGNPDNFSFLLLSGAVEQIELRQQVRIVSHIGDDIAFTPDIVALPCNARISKRTDADYANGKRSFFYVPSSEVIAAHECKSLVPFPELLVSFIGTFVAGHAWAERLEASDILDPEGAHLAPCLFIGGTASALHLKMIKGLKNAYPMNIVVGMHSGTWDLLGKNADIRRMKNPLRVENPLRESQ